MEFPRTSYTVTADIWFTRADGTKEPSRGVWGCFAESAADALTQHEIDVRQAANPSYAWEDVQIISVMQRVQQDDMEYGDRMARRQMQQ